MVILLITDMLIFMFKLDAMKFFVLFKESLQVFVILLQKTNQRIWTKITVRLNHVFGTYISSNH